MDHAALKRSELLNLFAAYFRELDGWDIAARIEGVAAHTYRGIEYPGQDGVFASDTVDAFYAFAELMARDIANDGGHNWIEDNK